MNTGFGIFDGSAYEVFNLVEGLVWLALAIGLPLWFRRESLKRRRAVGMAALAFLAFGLSDFCEIPTRGRLPLWLWIVKGFCVLALLKCRYDFLGPENFRWLDRTHVLVALVFVAAVFAMILPFLFPADFAAP